MFGYRILIHTCFAKLRFFSLRSLLPSWWPFKPPVFANLLSCHMSSTALTSPPWSFKTPFCSHALLSSIIVSKSAYTQRDLNLNSSCHVFRLNITFHGQSKTHVFLPRNAKPQVTEKVANGEETTCSARESLSNVHKISSP